MLNSVLTSRVAETRGWQRAVGSDVTLLALFKTLQPYPIIEEDAWHDGQGLRVPGEGTLQRRKESVERVQRTLL